MTNQLTTKKPKFTTGGMKGKYRDSSGRWVNHPEYSRWHSIRARCYKPRSKRESVNYMDSYMDSAWHDYRNFYNWLHLPSNEPRLKLGWHVDKDFLFIGNKTYSDDKCLLIPQKINNFLCLRSSERGDYPTGVCLYKKKNLLCAQVSNPITGKHEHLGYFDDPEKAHLKWRERKIEILQMMRDSGLFDGIQDNDRVFNNCITIIENTV
jgi:hypothetical protein